MLHDQLPARRCSLIRREAETTALPLPGPCPKGLRWPIPVKDIGDEPKCLSSGRDVHPSVRAGNILRTEIRIRRVKHFRVTRAGNDGNQIVDLLLLVSSASPAQGGSWLG